MQYKIFEYLKKYNKNNNKRKKIKKIVIYEKNKNLKND